MPSLLGEKAGSEPHGHKQDRPPAPRSTYDAPVNTHPIYIPPGLAPRAVSGGIEDVAGPRHSALGLEGIENNEQSMKAPTVRRSWYR